MSKKAIELKKENYTIQVNYSDESSSKKLMKFITPKGDEFEISAEEMISFLVNQVNMKTLEPTFVDSEKINVCEVMRQIVVKADRDIKGGEEIRINYKHPYPLEFALLEETYKIAKVDKDVKAIEITGDMISETFKKINPEMRDFTEKFYKSYQGVKLGVEPKK